MNIKRAKEEIKDTIEAYLLKDSLGEYVIPSIRQRPVLLIGPPGVGKTQIMEQISRECRIGLVSYTITHHTRQSAVGLPLIEKREYAGREYTVTEYTMSEIVASVYNRIEETGLKEGILFIDEVNCVSETLAPTMLQFLQCKTFGTHKIPEGWLIVAAGNPPEYNKSVREFDVVTLDRIKRIDVEPDLGVWKEYAYVQNIHPAILSYLGIRPEYFCRIETTVDGKCFATPRGWEDLSQLIQVYEQLGKKADRDVVGQYIQYPKIAKNFANYLELYYKYQNEYQVEEILSGVIKEELCDRLARAAFDERLSVTGLLLSKLTEGFKELQDKNRKMELLMEQLKHYRQLLLGNIETGDSGRSPAALLELISQELEDMRKQKEKSGLLSRPENRLYRQTISTIEAWSQKLRTLPEKASEEAWQWVRGRFMEESDAYEDVKDACGEKLEHAFDFMEAAFGNAQEMVIFITELNTGEAAVEFLNSYECGRYYQYNKALLFDEQEKGILEKIK
ncbi:AAA family ATPase [Lacrimispora sp. 210928-DFI.3.58]|uniref:AAA family ATPase n=1 Tax=Lacrimispora sp. 210928-DFI.3.58 TaxID=2883214 RepID=UPI001D0918AD|nr:AAA family ATPase [Lacrimispora sp. 210928-DFI.3.58]MCB7318877.1 AAA family ATPase [Lacrimispora sp. 210928-DFI.3.58]